MRSIYVGQNNSCTPLFVAHGEQQRLIMDHALLASTIAGYGSLSLAIYVFAFSNRLYITVKLINDQMY